MATKSVKLWNVKLFEADSKDAIDIVIDVSFKRLSTRIVSGGSTRYKVAKNEKQGPTTAEMTTKSVKLWNEQFFEADSKDAIDTQKMLSTL